MTVILVADDDPDISSLVAAKLRHAGYDVHVRSDGESALAAVDEVRPDLVVLDWMMPRLTGLEVCQQLRSRPNLNQLAILLLTAKAHEADLQQGLAAGANDYMVKPFSPRELLVRVSAALPARGD
ncbi:MAG: putative two-component response regulator [Acidimicrobiia bacterium]|nr:putative two-component response regulator [Acidimicrobiia bacterium]